jgi:hypothetical protein
MKRKLISIAILLGLVAVLAMPLPISGATTGTTVVTGALSDTIAVVAPAGFALTLDPSASQPITSAAKTVNVYANGIQTWNLKAHEAGGDGKMASSATPDDKLGSAMVLNAGAVGDVALSGTAQNIVTGHDAGSSDESVTFKQAIAYTDLVHADYAITVTFTVEFTP